MLLPSPTCRAGMPNASPLTLIAISHGADALTWHELERRANARARAFAAPGRQARRLRRDRAAQQQRILREPAFAVWKCGATPTSLSRRLPRGEAAAVLEILQTLAGGRRRGRLECAELAAGEFRAGGIFRGAARCAGRALLEGDDERRLDRTAEGDPRSQPGRDRNHDAADARNSASGLRCSTRVPLYHNAPFILSHSALFGGGKLTGMVQFDAEETLRLIERERVQWVNFVPTTDASDLGAARGGPQPLRRLQPADRASHGGADAALAEGEMDRMARAGAGLRELHGGHRAAGRPR